MAMKAELKGDVIDAYLRAPDVHDVHRAGLFGAGISLVIAVTALVLHGFNTWLIFWTQTPIIVPVAIHVLSVAVVLFFTYSLFKVGRDTRFMLLLGITTAVMGVFGAAGTLLATIMQFWHLRLAQSFIEWFSTIFPRFARTRPEDVYENIMFGRDDAASNYRVIPFMDVMSIGSESQKREALSRMTTNFHPSFAPAFSKALSDASNAIRVQAATSVARIENQFLERLLKITDVARRFPRDANVKLALAEHYDDYAFTGILDEERERVNRRRALEHYYEYLDVKPNDVMARIKVGRLLLRDKSPEQAADWFQGCMENGYSSDSLQIWYIESLFACGRFDELRKRARSFLSRLEPYRELRPELADSIKLWAGATAVSLPETAEVSA
jgi:polysaccharide biosynthesis protein PelE